MKFLYFLFLFLSVGCGSGYSPRYYTLNTPCGERDKDNCYTTDNCAWYIDTCYNRPTKAAPHIPEGLAEKKVKAIAAGAGFCAIDENNELWCVPKHEYNAWIYPHSSLKFKQVAFSKNSYSALEKICATTLNGDSVCFDGDKMKPGPAKGNIVKTIPADDTNKTVCAFDAQSNLFCDSISKLYEVDLPKFFESIKPLSIPLTDLYFRELDYNYVVYGLFSNGQLYRATPAPKASSKWQFQEVASDVYSVSTYQKALCVAFSSKGLACVDMQYGAQADIPERIKNSKILKIATEKSFACVILDKDRKLDCWGKKKVVQNLPQGLKGVQDVAVGENLVCYIDSESKLGCFSDDN